MRPPAVSDLSLAGIAARWPVLRQLRSGADGRGAESASPRTRALRPRTERAEHVVRSVCPYCTVGCGQRVFVENGRVSQIEGDPDSPISRGRLCPKGAASQSLVNGPLREYRVKYRPPYAEEWRDDEERTLRRSLGVVNLGGATLDNEENYCIKKLMTSLGFVTVENQARI